MELILFFVTSLIFYLLLSWKKKPVSRLPPGPPGLPLLGNGLQLVTQPHFACAKWAQMYGKLYTIHIGSSPLLVVNDAKIMKQLFGTNAATGKFSTEMMRMIFAGNYGLLLTEGSVWQEQTQFCFRTLGQFGFGQKVTMESSCTREVDILSGWLENQQLKHGKVFLKDKLDEVWGSMLWNMLTGDETKDIQIKCSVLINEWIRGLQVVSNNGLIFFPWIKYLKPVQSGYRGLKKTCDDIYACVKNYFDEHKRTKVNGEPPRDMIDAYIDKVESCNDPQSSFYGEQGWKHSYACIAQLMLGTADASTLIWFIFYLSVHPKVQRKLQEEIDREIGNSKEPSFIAKAKLPYMEAVILETIRCATLLAFGGMLKLLEDVPFDGYHLPKGLFILPNFYYAHNDKSVWGDPENFRPERFLEEQHLKEYVVSFQLGKRKCPGKFHVKSLIFFITTKLFHKYTFSTDPNVENVKEYLKPMPGFILTPKQLPIVVTRRT